MSFQRTRVAILGGGIRGTALAALLSYSTVCEVMLFERRNIASGTTSTNHGRLHCGAGLWRKNAQVMATRHRVGSELIRQLTAVSETHESGIYLIESPNDVVAFENACQRHGVPCQRVRASGQIFTNIFAGAFEIPEYAFNPAQVAGRLAACAHAAGAKIYTNTAVFAIEAGEHQGFRLELSNGTTVEVDIVLNALGNWANHLHSDLPLPRLQIQWQQWKILCLRTQRSDNKESWNRVVTIVEQEDILPSFIPHSPWMLFGCRLAPNFLPTFDPESNPMEQWFPYDQNHPMDRRLLEVHAKYFQPLQNLNARDIQENLFTFSGTYPTFAGVYPFYEESQSQPSFLLQNKEVPNYYIVCGENATTAIIDALEAMCVILPTMGDQKNNSTTIASFLDCLDLHLPETVFPATSSMIWNRVEEYTPISYTEGLDSLTVW